MTGLYANFFRIFVQFVSNSLWSKCNSKQCVWPEISMCGLLKRGFSTQRGNYTVTNPGLDKGRNMAWYPFRAMRGLLISTKRKDFRQEIFGWMYDFWIENWRNCKTSVQFPDFRYDLHDMITQTKVTTQTQCPSAKHKWQRKNMITTNVFNRM